MVILSMDQSTRVSGWAVFKGRAYVDSGVIDLHKIKDTSERSKQMGLEICEKLKEIKPDLLILEETQCQSNVDTVKKLSRIQGMAIGFAAAFGIETKIVEPSKWRAALGYHQGPKVSREELKQQSFDYVEKHFGLDVLEDEAEAICQNVAAQLLFDGI